MNCSAVCHEPVLLACRACAGEMTTMGQCYAYAHNRLNRLFFHPRSRRDLRPHTASRFHRGHHDAGARGHTGHCTDSQDKVVFIPHFRPTQVLIAGLNFRPVRAFLAQRNACLAFWFGWEVGGPPHATMVVSEILIQHHVAMYTQAHAQSAHAAHAVTTHQAKKTRSPPAL